MFSKKIASAAAALLVVGSMGLAACAPSVSAASAASAASTASSGAPVVQVVATTAPTFVNTSAVVNPAVITPAEAADLQFMREEEKLAHDVYVALYEKWGVVTFDNIAQSEQVHTDTIAALLERYGVSDPAAGEPVGAFENADLQALYDQLVAQGSQSVADALKVGGAIEEIDILDLEKRVAETDKADVQQVYENLKLGSYNHLRAFVNVLSAQTGEQYAPQYLTQDAYNTILAGSNGRGRGGRW